MSTIFNPVLAFAAGALTILSPCVLPLVPVVLASAAQQHRWGPVALAAGLVFAFTGAGLFIAAAGPSLGIDPDLVRAVGAVLLIAVGLALSVPGLQRLVERAAAPLANWGGQHLHRLDGSGLAGQAGIGILLGLVWSPCVGPTLGAATLLASQGQDLGEVGVVMAGFALGAATVLLILAFAARSLVLAWRGRLARVGRQGRRILGVMAFAVGLLIVTGADRMLETFVVNASPAWITELSTSI